MGRIKIIDTLRINKDFNKIKVYFYINIRILIRLNHLIK